MRESETPVPSQPWDVVMERKVELGGAPSVPAFCERLTQMAEGLERAYVELSYDEERDDIALYVADPLATADTMRDASVYARAQTYHQHVNLITSVGMLATQSVRHLHIHVVPRHPHDGLVLPWGDNERQSREYRENAYRFYSGEGERATRGALGDD